MNSASRRVAPHAEHVKLFRGPGSDEGSSCQAFPHSGHSSLTNASTIPARTPGTSINLGACYRVRPGAVYAGMPASLASSSSLYRFRIVTSETSATSLTWFCVTFSFVSSAAA